MNISGAVTVPLPWHHPATLVATFGGIGNLPVAPGTWGSLAALPLAWTIRGLAGPATLAAVAVAIFVLGCWAASRYIAAAGREDPGSVVVDEVAAQMLVLVPVRPELLTYAGGFLLFRLFDILKPWPVGWVDRNVKGGIGTMLDDLLAAIYAGAILYAFAWAMERP